MPRSLIALFLVAFLVLGAAILPAFAQDFPQVANLKPFSVETNFMSLAGYLRWLVFTQTSQWISRDEAVRVVNEQLGQASR